MLDTGEQHSINILLDSGCTNSTINAIVIEKYQLATIPLAKPIGVKNADGTPNTAGMITHVADVRIRIGDHDKRLQLSVSNLGADELFLGYDWLIKHNPTIDWKKKTIDFDRCESNCGNLQDNPDYIRGYIRAFATKSSDLAIKEAAKKPKQTLEELIPPSLLEYHELFEPTAFDKLPQHRKWDHAIDFKPDANIHNWKVKTYPLSVHEQDTLDEFLKENLRTG